MIKAMKHEKGNASDMTGENKFRCKWNEPQG